MIARAVAVALIAIGGCTGDEREPAERTAQASLPRLPRVSTELPCPPEPRTTRELEGCGAREVASTNRAVERRARKVYALLSPSGRRKLVAAERAWLVYRRQACAVESSKYEGGSVETVIWLGCVARQNRRHVRELEVLERELRVR